MKLVSLQLENFRSFESCALELQREGLIGVSGPNGAGKSTLLAAINYALFGRGKGSRELKPERDGMPAGAKCEVTLEFTVDELACKVVRGKTKAKLTVDGQDWVSSGQVAVTEKVIELLGIGKANFAMTFYARQRELQALRAGDTRKDQLETLLGLDRIKNACDLAHEKQSEQEKVVRAIEAELPSIADAEAHLRKAEEDAQQRTPSVECAREARESADKARERARTALTDARERAARALALEGKAAVATSELAAAAEREQATRAALTSAQAAASEVVELSPVAAKVGELRARDRTLELEAHAAEQAKALREKRHTAQLAVVATTDELAAKADPAESLQAVQGELTNTRAEHERVTGEVIGLSSQQESVRTAATEAAKALAGSHHAHALDEEIKSLSDAPAAADARASESAALEAEEAQLSAHLADEREHYEHVQRDGRDATCPRCKAPYGDRWEEIIAEFEETLTRYTTREAQIKTRLKQIRKERKTDATKLEKLASLEAERRSLGEIPADVSALERAAEGTADAQRKHATSYESLTRQRTELADAVTPLERKLAELQAQAAARNEVSAQKREAERDVEQFEKQLAGLSVNGYDRDAHEQVRLALTEASAAETRCSELRAQVAQIELLQARLMQEEKLAADARTARDDLAAAAAQRAPDKDAPETAERVWDEADSAYREADTSVHDAEQQALAESNAVAQARADLETAQRLKGQVDAQREELSIRRVVVQVLHDYRTAVQQEAVPSLEQETAELLRRTTRGRYSDVEITSDGGLRINDMGTSYDLERFSGGEQDLANLCMRLALSKLLARRNGMEARFVILDEVFGSQDADRRRALIEALRELDQEFGQILIVSHFDDFMEHCDLRVTVKAEGGKSIAETITA
jgi:DNA repair protein SbcC/Rad50